jgi:hypothetical protein
MHALLQSLTGGDRRSIGESNRVASLVLEQPALMETLFQGIEPKSGSYPTPFA